MWQNDGCSETAIKAFLYNFEKLTSGANLMIPESALSAVESLPSYDALTEEKPELLKDTVRTAAPPRYPYSSPEPDHNLLGWAMDPLGIYVVYCDCQPVRQLSL